PRSVCNAPGRDEFSPQVGLPQCGCAVATTAPRARLVRRSDGGGWLSGKNLQGGARPTLDALDPGRRGARPGPAAQIASYFFFAGERWLLRNEIPVRMAFCCTAAAVRPKALAACAAVPLLASFFRVLSSLALQEAPSLEGRFAIIISKQILTTRG